MTVKRPAMIEGIKHAARFADIVILSDANHFFIDTVLDHHQLKPYIAKVITNPAVWDDSGRLNIMRYDNLVWFEMVWVSRSCVMGSIGTCDPINRTAARWEHAA